MKLNFSTIFFANYAAKGIALYHSLERVCKDFHIYIFTMDDDCYQILQSLCLSHATIIPLEDLENYYPALLIVKPSRKKGEYSWTCKGPSILYCFDKYGIEDCMYLDADLYFFSDPTPLFTEDTTADVMLTEHRYSDLYNQAETNGKYCAGTMYFKSSENALSVLKHWTKQCIEWCYSGYAPGRFGDQKYLDEFHSKWNNIHDIEHIGFCAPWNIQQYEVSLCNGEVMVAKDGKSDNLIFYHFHFLRNQDFGKYNEFYLGPYALSNETLRYIYTPYLNELKSFTKKVDGLYSTIDVLASITSPLSKVRLFLHWIKNGWKRNKVLWKRR